MKSERVPQFAPATHQTIQLKAFKAAFGHALGDLARARELDRECGPKANFTSDSHFPSHLLKNLLAYAKAQACASGIGSSMLSED